MGLETVSCVICDRNNLKTLDTLKNDQGIVQCNNCGLVFVSPRWNKEALKDWYEDPNFWPVVYSGREYSDEPFDFEHFKNTGTYKTNKMELELVQKYKASGKILDVGCGPGLFLYLARNSGYSTLGVELSERMGNWGTKHLDIDVNIGYFEDIDFENERFDIVMMWDLLEHLSDPLLYLEIASRVMKDDAYIFGQIPNYDGLVNKVKTWADLAGLRKKKWSHFGLPQHIYWFTPKTMGMLIRKAGLELVEVQSWSHLKYKVEPRRSEVFLNRILGKRNLTSYFVFVGKKTVFKHILLSSSALKRCPSSYSSRPALTRDRRRHRPTPLLALKCLLGLDHHSDDVAHLAPQSPGAPPP